MLVMDISESIWTYRIFPSPNRTWKSFSQKQKLVFEIPSNNGRIWRIDWQWLFFAQEKSVAFEDTFEPMIKGF